MQLIEAVERGQKFPFLLCIMEVSELFELATKGLRELSFEDTFVVRTKINNTKVEVFLDSDEFVDFYKCQKLSRWLEAIFDEKKYFGEKYTLEVSSAGVGSPLIFLRQYPKNIGRIIEVTTNAGDKVKGTLKDVKDNHIFVVYEETVKEGKKNKKVIIEKEFLFEDILESKIKISFK